MTTPTAQSLDGLIERVKAATGPDQELEAELFDALIGVDALDAKRWYGGGWEARVTASIDAALALVERCLPGWGLEIGLPSGRAYGSCRLFPGDNRNKELTCFGKGQTAPLAIILALLTAMQDQS